MDILRLNGVSFLHKYLNIRLTLKILGERVTMAAMNLEHPVCWSLLTQQENPVSHRKKTPSSHLPQDKAHELCKC